MNHTYHYQGFDVKVAVETDFKRKLGRAAPGQVRYLAVVKICKAGDAVSVFTPLRFGESQGKPFLCEEDALMGGYGAGQRIIDDLLRS